MPSIKEKPEKSKPLIQCLQNRWFFVGSALILAVIVVFGAIKLNALFRDRSGVKMAETAFDTNGINGAKSGLNISSKEGSYVAAKTGTAYYFPWCGIAGRIKDVNKVWFSTRADAEKAGFKPSANCHGLK